MIIKTIRRVYVLLCENVDEQSPTTIGVYSDYDKAVEAMQRLQAVATFDDYYTISATPLDDFTYVEQEEERYQEITCDD